MLIPVICWEDEEYADDEQRAPDPGGPVPGLGLLPALVLFAELAGGEFHVLEADVGPELLHRRLHPFVLALPEQPAGRLGHLGP